LLLLTWQQPSFLGGKIMITSKQVINDFWKKNKCMLGASAVALASLLVIALFNNGEDVRVTRQNSIGLFLVCAVIGKWFDVATEKLEDLK
jgi:hypothetical protein